MDVEILERVDSVVLSTESVGKKPQTQRLRACAALKARGRGPACHRSESLQGGELGYRSPAGRLVSAASVRHQRLHICRGGKEEI